MRQAKVFIEGALIGTADNDYRNWKFYHMHRKFTFSFDDGCNSNFPQNLPSVIDLLNETNHNKSQQHT